MGHHYWRDKRCVVTGGSAGFGRVLVERLVESGARVIMVGRDEARLRRAVTELASPAGLSICAADVTRDDEVARLFDEVDSRLGGLDLLVNAAGRSARGRLDATPLDEHRRMWELNFLASVRCSQAALPRLAASRGHLVLIGSLACKFAPRYLGAYATSKAPLAAYAQQTRLEAREQGTHVLLVCPGPIRREDAGQRYDAEAADLPESARRPGGGAKLKGLDARRLADELLRACERRRVELVRPRKARLLAVLAQLAPSWADRLLLRYTS